MRQFGCALLCVIACTASQALADSRDFDVQFDSCTEYVGIGLVPFANARALVPSPYALVSGPNDSAFIVVRVASCNAVTVAGNSPSAGRTAQIGIMLAGQDPSADINNYLLWFITDSGALHGKLQAAGVDNGTAQTLAFAITPGTGPIAVDVAAPRFPGFSVRGQASSPTASAQRFVANWFSDGASGTLRMHSEFPAIQFGAAHTTMTTSDPQLRALIGGSSLSFPVLDSDNTWSSAMMQARLP